MNPNQVVMASWELCVVIGDDMQLYCTVVETVGWKVRAGGWLTDKVLTYLPSVRMYLWSSWGLN